MFLGMDFDDAQYPARAGTDVLDAEDTPHDPGGVDAPDPGEDDGPVDTDGDTEDTDTDTDTDGGGASGGTATRSGPAINRGLIRRIVAKAVEFGDAPAEQRALVAHLLGVTDTVPELVAAVFTAGRAFAVPAADLRSIADADPMEAGVTALSLPRPRLKAVWTLLVVLGRCTGTLPGSDTKAALGAAKAVHATPAEVWGHLDAALLLARRT